jgi:hypothetical protein
VTDDQVQPGSVQEWREWLAEHHIRPTGVWLVTWRAGSSGPRISYEESVEQAWCGQQRTEAGRRAAAEPSESDGSDGSATLRILGRTADPDTRRLREWATAHQVTSTIVDLDDDPGACELLAELGLAPDAAPIAVWHEQAVQRASTDDLADLQHKRSPGG